MIRDTAHHVDTVFDAVKSSSRAAQSPVAASWCRSALHHGLDPSTQRRRERVSAKELATIREKNGVLLAVATPVMDQLFRAVGRSGCGVVLGSRAGILMERRASDADAIAFADAGLAPGVIWGEAEEGTNGIGTCLFEGRPVIIHRDQHFSSRNIGISCMDAPIYAPNGQLIGALDVTSCRDDHSLMMADMIASLVQETARTIERHYFARAYDGARVIFTGDDPVLGSGLLAVDRDDMVVGASRAARIRFRLTNESLETPRSLADVMGEEGAVSLHDGERGILRRALAQTGGNATRAAQMLGIGRATLYRRMKKAGLDS